MLAKIDTINPAGNWHLLACMAAVLLLAAMWLPNATGNAESSPTRLEGDLYAEPLEALKHFSALDESEMAVMRGGLRVGGVNIRFGVNLRTTINGVAHERSYSLTSTGLEDALPTTTAASTGTTTQNFSTDDVPNNMVVVGGNSGNSFGDVTHEGLNLSGFEDAEGVVFMNDDGTTTAVLNQITQDRIVSFLVTNADDQVIDQHVDVNITIENFSKFQNSARDAVLGGGLTRAVGDATAPR